METQCGGKVTNPISIEFQQPKLFKLMKICIVFFILICRYSPLVSAAIQGKVAILDGIHRIHRGTLAVLHRLVHDRELQLYDGTRLLRSDRYEEAKRLCGLTDKQVDKTFSEWFELAIRSN